MPLEIPGLKDFVLNLGLAETLDFTVANNTGHAYLNALVTFFIVFLILKLFKIFLLHKIRKIAKKTTADIDDLLVKFFNEINILFYAFLAVYVSTRELNLNNSINKVFSTLLLIFAVFYSVKAINAAISYLVDKQIKLRKKQGVTETSLMIVLKKLFQICVWIIASLLVLSNLGVNITSLLAGVGIGGIAIAFALQVILEDVFSAFSIYFDKPFEEGDFIIIGTDMGTVQHIGIKSTRIQTLQGQELVISNRELTKSRVNNYKKMKERRVVFGFGVVYGTQVKKLKQINKIVKEAVDKTGHARLDRAHFKEFGNFSLNYEIVYYVDTRDYNIYMDIQQKINLRLAEEFEKHKIDFAFPTQTIHLRK